MVTSELCLEIVSIFLQNEVYSGDNHRVLMQSLCAILFLLRFVRLACRPYGCTSDGFI